MAPTMTTLKAGTMCWLLCLATVNVYGQKEDNNWFFGNGAGMSFSTGVATVTSGSAMNAFEGCTSMSDGDGNLLFYSDGSTVWDATHSPMSNGTALGGNSSSTQSGVAIPDPGNPDQYYMFSAAAQTAAGGIQYCIIDMTQNGGLGDVTIKNQGLLDPACEKITAVNHCNGRDIWVIAHGWESDSFFAWLVTPTGINPPIISTLGYIPNTGTAETIGYMKATSDHSKIGLAVYTTGIFEIYDFNNATGELSNVRTMNMSATHTSLYGFEFSANGRYCYVSSVGGGVYQYDTEAGNAAQILASQQVMAASSNMGSFGAIQIGPDSNLYITKAGGTTLDMIRFADQPFPAATYVVDAVTLDAGTSGGYGLPNFTKIVQSFGYDGVCEQAPFEFYGTSLCADSIRWYYGDTASGELNTSVGDTGYHEFTDGGNYTVTQVVYYSTFVDSLKFDIYVEYLPDFTLGPDLEICPDEVLTLQPDNPGAAYLWGGGETTSTLDITEPGEYTLEITTNTCVSTDTILVTPLYYPTPPDLGEDIELCAGGVVTLQPETYGHSIAWQDGSEDPSFRVVRPGTYSLTLGTSCGTATDEIEVSYKQCQCNIWVPTALTPDADGDNDRLVLQADCPIAQDFVFQVFNRWGQLVHSSTDFNDVWSPDLDMPLGVYVYRMQYFDELQEVDVKRSGNITLIR